jgi:hypothetical protein
MSIYKSFMGRMSEAWYALSSEQQAELLARLDEERKRAGGKSVIMCDSSWSSDHVLFFGVEEFPDLDAVQAYHAALMKLNWFRYIDGNTVLGTKSE